MQLIVWVAAMPRVAVLRTAMALMVRMRILFITFLPNIDASFFYSSWFLVCVKKPECPARPSSAAELLRRVEKNGPTL
jgi:hypothetical protein